MTINALGPWCATLRCRRQADSARGARIAVFFLLFQLFFPSHHSVSCQRIWGHNTEQFPALCLEIVPLYLFSYFCPGCFNASGPCVECISKGCIVSLCVCGCFVVGAASIPLLPAFSTWECLLFLISFLFIAAKVAITFVFVRVGFGSRLIHKRGFNSNLKILKSFVLPSFFLKKQNKNTWAQDTTKPKACCHLKCVTSLIATHFFNRQGSNHVFISKLLLTALKRVEPALDHLRLEAGGLNLGQLGGERAKRTIILQTP